MATAGKAVKKKVEAVPEKVHVWPYLVRLEFLCSLLVIVALTVWSIVIDAPLEEAANPTKTPNPSKAPWYFLWLQELVTITTFHIGSFTINGAFVGGILIPGFLVILALIWPYIDKSPIESTGVWFHKSRKWQNIVFLAIIAAVLILTFVGTFMRGPYWELFWPWEAWPLMPKLF